MKKRGLSDVVTTVLLILLGILLVALLWIMISAFLKGKNPDISSFNTELRIDTVCVNSAKNVSVLVKKIRADDTLNGFYLAVYDSNGNANSTFFNENFKNSISGWFNIDKTQHRLDGINKISVIPVFVVNNEIRSGKFNYDAIYGRLSPGCVSYDSIGANQYTPPEWTSYPNLGPGTFRYFSSSTYSPGNPVTVNISVSIGDPTVCDVDIEETPPAGWTVNSISGHGVGTFGATGKIIWTYDGPDNECHGAGTINASFVVGYVAIPPIGETGTKSFDGVMATISYNGVNYNIDEVRTSGSLSIS